MGASTGGRPGDSAVIAAVARAAAVPGGREARLRGTAQVLVEQAGALAAAVLPLPSTLTLMEPVTVGLPGVVAALGPALAEVLNRADADPALLVPGRAWSADPPAGVAERPPVPDRRPLRWAGVLSLCVAQVQAGSEGRALLATAWGPDRHRGGPVLTQAAAEILTAVLGPDGRPHVSDESREFAVGSENRALSLFEQTPAIIAVARGPDHVLTYANRRFIELTRRPGMLAMPGRIAFPELDQVGIFDLLDEIYESGRVHTGNQVRLRVGGDGEARDAWFNFVFQPTRDVDGRVDGIFCHAVEVTDLVAARHQAERATARFEALVQGIDAIVWEAEFGAPGYSFVSKRAETKLRYPLERWFEPGFWRSILHPADREQAARFADPDGLGAADRELTYRVLDADGRTVWMHDIVRVERGSGGRPDRLRGVMVDITARKEAELQRESMQAHLLQVQKLESLGVLAGGIAHDFNNILTGVLGNASLALDVLTDESPARDPVEQVVTGARRAADLTRQLLAYSGKGSFRRDPVDLSELVEEEMVRVIGASVPKKVRVELDLDDALLAVEGDTAQLQQIVMNLVLNAAEAIGEEIGTVLVRTAVTSFDGSGEVPPALRTGEDLQEGPSSQSEHSGYFRADELLEGSAVLLEVIDSGCGMDEETRARVFDPFFSTKDAGRGLGLSAVVGIVRSHGGSIRVASRPGRGTTFQVFLPASGFAAPKRRPEERRDALAGAGKVLIVDDEQAVRDVAGRVLERLGFEVLRAEDGARGIELFEQHQSDIVCVLLDLTMPDLGGDEVFERLRTIRASVPVVLSSGYDQTEATRHLSAEPAGFLAKPYTSGELEAAISEALSVDRSR